MNKKVASIVVGVAIANIGLVGVSKINKQNEQLEVQAQRITELEQDLSSKTDLINNQSLKIVGLQNNYTKMKDEYNAQKGRIGELEGAKNQAEQEKNQAIEEKKKSEERLQYLERRNVELVDEVKKKTEEKQVANPLKIAVDIGHNAEHDSGATSQYGTEDVFTRAVGEELIFLLEKEGYEVLRVHPHEPTSTNNSLRQRIGQSNEKDADLFISVHFNKVESESANGTEVFVNNVEQDKVNSLANSILNGFESYGFKNRGVKQANLFVLKNSDCPAILVECAFISNRSDMCKYEPYKFAQNIFEGVKSNFVNK